MPETSR